MSASTAEIDRFLQLELVRRRLGEVTAVEAAGWLDEAGPPRKHGNWFIVRRDLEARDSADMSRRRPSEPETQIKPASTSEGDGHRITLEWLGEEVVTLEDLLRSELRALCIGINPAPTSVERGHYYQGRSGQLFLARLRAAGLLPAYDGRWEDDVAFELGVGQTDVVKRPTAKAEAIGAAEFAYGKRALAERLKGVRAELVIFTFKGAATKVIGNFEGHGFISGLSFCGGDAFVMPGPYEKREVADRSLSELRAWVKRHSRLTS